MPAATATCIRLAALVVAIILCGETAAADWPMWRFDATRSAASPHGLPDRMEHRWTLAGTPRKPVWDDPLNQDLMPYDQIFEPIVANGMIYLAYNDRDKLTALDLRTGKTRWTFYADAPIRFAPAAWEQKVFLTSDDGFLYCLDGETGRELWRFRGGPSARKALGNERIVSAWPARGGPVVREGTVYFAASIWPFMGTFIYAIDADSGAVQWCNDGTSSDYIKQPHNADSFAGVAPQGALAATADAVIVPGGRSPPAVLDRRDGSQRYFKFGGKGVGGSLVLADDDSFYVHTRYRGVLAHDLAKGNPGKFHVNEPVLHEGWAYAAGKDSTVEAYDAKRKRVWSIDEVDASGDLIMAGDRLYAAGGGKLTALALHADRDKAPTIAWRLPVEGEVLRLLAADEHLLAVTLEGRVHVFSAPQQAAAQVVNEVTKERSPAADVHAQRMGRLVEQTGSRAGYALVFGLADSAAAEALLEESDYRITAVDADAGRVDAARRQWDAQGMYGARITAHVGDPQQFQAPPYVAHLVVVGEELLASAEDPSQLQATLRAAFRSVRPYGGVLFLASSSPRQAALWQAAAEQCLSDDRPKVIAADDGLMIVREGALPGAGSWTHQYGDAANSLMSGDSRVAAPLGILWFGGNSNLDILPRHGHGPPEQVIGGRLFIEGMNSLSARDVYTGRVIWKRVFENLDTHGIYFDDSYRDTPLSTAYNQKHIYGANARGTNFVATSDTVYLVLEDHCLLLDPATGATRSTIKLPDGDPKGREWGFLAVAGDVLLAGDGFANYGELIGDTSSRDRFIVDMSASRGLVGFDRRSGKQLWRVAAEHSFLHNGIACGGEKVYVLDRLPFSVEERLRRRGKEKESEYRVAAIDLKSGQLAWETRENVFGTWLSYSAEHDMLLQAGAKAKDRSPDEVGQGMTVYHAATGKVAWAKPDLKYNGPCILHHATIITGADSGRVSAGAFSLLDGSPRMTRNPLTGLEEAWKFTRAYGCNYPIASENLLTFRSGAAGFYDLQGHSGSGNFGGFKSGCTSNLVVADGVLNAPDYTRTCSCSYQNQTSLALIPMPDVELWTNSKLNAPGDDRIERVGINLGAPGDRRAADGLLWLEYPAVGGASPDVEIDVDGDKLQYFRRHASQVQANADDELAWVAASGVEGVSAVTIKLADDSQQPARYRVRLHFVEPNAQAAAGDRVFQVEVQGREAASALDVVDSSGSPLHALTLDAGEVEVGEELEIRLKTIGDSRRPPVLCGISAERVGPKQ